MLIKIDHTVSSLLSEDRADCVKQMAFSKRMYAWVEGENIAMTIEKFAIANRSATVGDLIEWTKKTYMDRSEAFHTNLPFDDYKLQGDYNPTKGEVERQEFGKHGVSAIDDAIPPRRKQTGIPAFKKVAEPGQEAKVDAEDKAALDAEKGEEIVPDEPKAPPSSASARDFPPLEPGQRPDSPDQTPLAKRGLGK
jgi:hypothetical protein